ncbi:hypothetical protein THTE_3620 [Thermogutta terrifontis]|uniref:Uncharacterized protein n=1 Tax=Thermogutta terrifontis TaxID=1331910 RepID=A0A286RJS6_9BACT|nr:hypothetical protein THTE_3620 [Thermogutta terrifontis]
MNHAREWKAGSTRATPLVRAIHELPLQQFARGIAWFLAKMGMAQHLA